MTSMNDHLYPIQYNANFKEGLYIVSFWLDRNLQSIRENLLQKLLFYFEVGSWIDIQFGLEP